MKWLFVVMCFFLGCQTVRKSPITEAQPGVEELKLAYAEKAKQAAALRNPFNGWIIWDDCDGMLWSGKYATTACSVKIGAAEFEPGRFGRRPSPRCYDEVNGIDQGSKTTWSRDMAMGLFAYAWVCKKLDPLIRHRRYGIANNWIMGQPIADGRTVYTPQVIGLMHEIIYKLGGENSPNRALPSVYPEGLVNYKAHLQMINIWLRGELMGEISRVMHKRIKEHSEREPYNPFYQYMAGLYEGNQTRAIKLLLDPSMPMGSYVRCKHEHRCKLADWLFTARLVLESVKPAPAQ